MSKHTPGPWKVSLNKNVPLIYQDKFSNYTIWAIAKINDDEVGDRKANAILIAAAPELLESLEEMLTTPGVNMKEVILKARSVIKKAKGET